MSTKKILLLYPSTNRHLGLWKDLETDERCYLRSTDWRKYSNKFMVYLQFIYLRIYNRLNWLPFHYYWFNYHDIFKISKSINHLLLIDGALNAVELSELRKCKRKNPALKISLYLINSIEASSPILKKVRPKISNYDWDNIYTFDPVEAQKYHYTYLGFNYYSTHLIEKSDSQRSDVFFVGGLKGGRTKLIYDLYNHLVSSSVRCDFFLMPIDNKEVKRLSGIYYYDGWRPYEEILQHTKDTGCILEIVQKGQNGATLRYFEAVSMNKKLLTNNPHIVEYPFYNPQWMKIFTTVDDIDVDWLKRDEPIDYQYKGNFSPTYLVDFILSDNKKDEKI